MLPPGRALGKHPVLVPPGGPVHFFRFTFLPGARMRRLVPVLSLLAALAACQPAAPTVDVAAEEQAIRAQVAAFNAAIASYNDSAATAIYAPDAVLLPPNQGRQTGSAYLEQMVAGLEPLKATFVVTTANVVVAASGDMALEEGTWVTTIPATTGAGFQDNGKYLAAWKKSSGVWLVQYDIWNSDNAPATAEVKVTPHN